MRYVRIFFLYFEQVFQYRSQIFIWFLVSLFHPLIYLLFWSGRSAGASVFNQGPTSIVAYYLLFIIAGGFFVHVDADAFPDIVEGNLATYLLKPFSYLKFKFFSELPWRLIQGSFGLFILLLFIFMLGFHIKIVTGVDQILTALFISILAYYIMFLFKMIILLSALWVTDISGLQSFADMILIIFAGFIMPIYLFPSPFGAIATMTPFPYMIYYPVTAFLGGVLPSEIFPVIIMQCIWLLVLYGIYVFMWSRGVKKFTGVGI